MDGTSTTGWGGGIGFLAILFILIFAFVGGRGFGGWGNGWGNNGYGFGNGWGAPFGADGAGFGASSYGFQNYKATCDAEKAEIINTATTQYRVEQQAAATRELVSATANATQTKIDYYAYQDLRDRLSEEQRKVLTLENQLFVKDQLAPINATLASISCNMLRRPDVTGIGAVCPNSAIINGLGINTLNGLNGLNGFNNCGCSGNVLA